MPSSPLATGANLRPDDNWGPPDDQSMGPGGNTGTNGASLPTDEQHLAVTARNSENQDYPHRGGSNASDGSVSGSKGDTYREKQVKVLRSPLPCLSFANHEKQERAVVSGVMLPPTPTPALPPLPSHTSLPFFFSFLSSSP